MTIREVKRQPSPRLPVPPKLLFKSYQDSRITVIHILPPPSLMTMSKKDEKGKGKKARESRPGKTVSFESVIFLFAFLGATSDQTTIMRGLGLALRGPALLRDFIFNLAASQGIDLRPLLGEEDSATRAEVRELAEPFLKKGAAWATIAQIADLYLFHKERTPENIVYAFYTGIRFFVAGERTPTKEESARIWEAALMVARTSKIGEPFWKELEEQSPRHLEDWIEERKEDARKRYKTFLGQKRRAEQTAERAFKSLMSDIFGNEDETS
jgi:hypothetical protein